MTDTILYYSPSTASLVVHWLLIELDIPHRLELVDFDTGAQRSPEYLRLNPQGRVPTLVLDGQVLTESAAIAMHLADLHPRAGLAPAIGTPERAAYYRWLFFCAYTLMPAYRSWFYPDEPAGEANIEPVKAAARASLEYAWQQVADHLEANGPYLLGERRSAADFVLTMLMRWSRYMPRPTDDWPVLEAFAARMKALPSFHEAYRREGITDWQ
ncbi:MULTISPECIES: glutathione S-transferase family protein [Pseudoxanthomonas]|jgi:glutathione S-transferase|uniref:Glutathione S-transferase family protein n=1 Tax=Pseudoxanthomonas winnipegensis TaxID=2480810 RepID=A0A4Q8L700_9GAMM|nr:MULTISPECIES: glutathione S-transferase family protein [Pseudoxanthomonas]PZP63111.1 MAG: glutathione S-transferase [Pseudoxanthomonas spadix]TAA23734.1 glutathione S-transferase family protein [Pseudoxanthomonas winnipegensis]TMN17895.1 glutathione S-transferase family protein [Pseudoxanthomonas sp. X-1]UAY76448.1 glutathione S-transferase family protein [Pseudoxanthomonas sp. X-1]